jgi:AraC family transcriptional regulator
MLARRHDPLAAALSRKCLEGAGGSAEAQLLAAGRGWQAFDVVCTCGPRDRPFEERHATDSVSLILAGTFACRSRCGTSLLAPGSWFLVRGGEPLECSHQHGEGDRCLSFQFEAETFARLAHAAGTDRRRWTRQSLPPLRAHAALVARAILALRRGEAIEEIAFEAAGSVLNAAAGSGGETSSSRQHGAVARVIRGLSGSLDSRHSLLDLAAAANLSPYHFLRTFKSITGLTPHQWLLRARLREAAQRLAASRAPVTTIALDVGFEDLSNFIRSFRAEFGQSPRQWRAAAA